MVNERVLGTPIVLERAGKKKRRRRSDGEHVELHLYRAAERTADAFSRGLRRYEKARRKGEPVVELLPNMARGMATTAGRLAPIPFDLLRAGWTPSVRRAARRTVRQLDR